MCAAAPKGKAPAAPEVIAPTLTLIDEDSPSDTRQRQRRGREQVTNTGLNIPSPGTQTGGPSRGLAIPS